ncbi:MAG: A24 family peptidase [Gammaproteobacteria bacterium]|nr:A24 family peptidase [Gammaproteobacteria bacterium]NNC68907.1 prepilin peptidase [Gammaproteobacteria bacterium]
MLLTYSFIIGAFIGSFLNVVIHRIPVMLERQWKSECQELLNPETDTPSLPKYNLSVPRSHCPACNHQVKVIENIPIISYLFLKGKCSSCGIKISPQYPFVELLTAILTTFIMLKFGFSIQALGGVIFTWFLIALSGIDIKTQLLPDDLTFPFLWLGIIFNLFTTYTDLTSSVLGAIFGYLTLWSVFHLFKLITGKEGMGYGDFKLLAALGAWLGWQSLPLIILFSSAVGAVIGIFMIVSKLQERSQPIPFGPYLAVAGWIAMLYGNQLISLYLSKTL